MPRLESCPAPDKWLAFLVGKLHVSESDLMVEHLQDCPVCMSQIDGLDEASDAIVRTLRRSPVRDEFMIEEECQHALAASRRMLTSDECGLGRLRDYQLRKKLGQGGMGAVYEAYHTHLNRNVAIKILPPEKMRSAQAISRFKREMQAIGKLDHANIVRAQDAGEEDGQHFLVMERIDGFDLSAIAKHEGSLRVADVCEIARQTAEALQYAHDNGLVHRDIKPSNLMLTVDGQVKILDLGLALLHGDLPDTHDLTSDGQVMGTLDYMAPEQLGDSHAVDHRADIYSLGATLYRLLTGCAPYGDKRFNTPTKKLMAIATKPFKPIQDFRNDVPPKLVTMLDRMMAKDPDERFPMMAEVAKMVALMANGSDLAKLVQGTEAKAEIGKSAAESSTFDEQEAPKIDTAPYRQVTGSKPLVKPAKAQRKPPIHWIAVATLVFVAMFIAYQILLTIRDRDGQVLTTVEAPQDATIAISQTSTDEPLSNNSLKPPTNGPAMSPKVAGDWLAYGLVAHWTFDDNNPNVARDSSGNGHDGRVFSGEKESPVIRSTDVPPTSQGKGSSLLLVGKQERLVVPHDEDLNIDGSLTITTWINIDASENFVVEFIRKNRRNADHLYERGYLLNTNSRMVTLGLNYSIFETAIPQHMNLADRQWHHVASRWDGKAWTVFFDGQMYASGEWLGNILTNEEPLMIGSVPHGFGVTRLIDDVRIYRRALSDEDIRRLANLKNDGEIPFDAVASEFETTESMSPMALVTRPAKIDGVKSWSIETVVPRGHSNTRSIGGPAISPDGTVAAIATDEGVVRIYDTRTGDEIHAWLGHSTHGSWGAIGWSFDQKYLATAANDGTGHGHDRVYVWEYPSGRVLQTLDLDPAMSFAWSPNQHQMAIWSKSLLLWEPGGALTRVDNASPNSPINKLAWSPDGRLLALGGEDSRIWIWNFDAQRIEKILEPPVSPEAKARLEAISWSPDSHYLAARSSWPDHAVRIWNVDDGTIANTIDEVVEGNPAWSPDGQMIATFDHRNENVAVIRDATIRGKEFKRIHLDTQDTCTAFDWSPDGNTLLALVGGAGLRCYDTPNGDFRFAIDEVKTYLHTWRLNGFLFMTPPTWERPTYQPVDGDWGFYGHMFWNPQECEVFRSKVEVPSSPGSLSQNGRLFATWHWNERKLSVFQDGELGSQSVFDSDIHQIAWAHDNRRLGVATKDHILVWNPYTDEISNTRVSPKGGTRNLTWNTTDTLAIADHHGNATLWNVNEQEVDMTLTHKEGNTTRVVDHMVFSPDGHFFATASNNWGCVNVWNVEGGDRIRVLQGFPGVITIDWIGEHLNWVCNDGTIRGLRLNDDLAPQRLAETFHQGHDLSASFSPGGNFVAIGRGASRWIFEAATGECVSVITGISGGHVMQFSPDGHYLASTDASESIVYCVETESGERLTLLPSEFESRFGWQNNPEKARIAFGE